jgi:hypothetical protein
MLAASANTKKRIETHYMEEARRASSVFPVGKLEPHEKPDFLLFADKKIGIELTELCREEPRAEAGRLSKVPDKAQELYGRFPQAEPVDVSAAFWHAESVAFNVLTKSLADFVYANRISRVVPANSADRALPVGALVAQRVYTSRRGRGSQAS